MRPIWTGGISFGLIYIPVTLFSAVKPDEIQFHMVRKKDLAPIGYQKIAKPTGESVEKEDIVKAVEMEDGSMVTLEDSDFEKANPRRTKSIDILQFMDEKEIDLKLAERPYYLEPEEASKKTYYLFLKALLKSKKAALGRFVLKNKEYLAIIKAERDQLVLIQVRYSDEIKLPVNDDFSKIKVEQSELELAEQIINNMTKPFEPGKYKESFKNEIQRIINAKRHKKPLVPKEMPLKATDGKDIMSKLMESLKQTESL